MGLHTDEHNLLLDQLSACETNADVVYRKWHNGDAEINDIVMQNRDDVREAKSMVAAHIRSTGGDDAKLINLEADSKKYQKILRVFWPVAIGFIGFLLREAYTMMM